MFLKYENILIDKNYMKFLILQKSILFLLLMPYNWSFDVFINY